VLWSALLLGLTGCPDPQGRFDEFAGRVITLDAGPTGPDAPPLQTLPDITGTFLVGLYIKATDTHVELLGTTGLTQAMGTTPAKFEAHLHFLKLSDRTPIASPNVDITNVTVSSAGEFTATIPTLPIPRAANPLGFDATAENVVMTAMIQNKDRFCGTVTGNVTKPQPVDLAGSTLAGIRVPDGAQGAALPPAQLNCTIPPVDGGM
jgi:hypothetical protein